MNPKEIKESLSKNDKGNPYDTIQNNLTIFRNDDKFQNVRYDIMREAPIIISGLHERRLWTDKEKAQTRLHMEMLYGLPGRTNMNDAFTIMCDERKYSPVQEIIKAVQWDGTARCEDFFIKWARSPAGAYSRECGRLFFAQGINRAFEPGAKCDYVIVLSGGQGKAKSTLAKWLAIEKGFYLSLTSIEGKDALQQLCGRWVVELEEMLATIDGKTSVEKVKQFISSDTDNFRPPYGHYPIDHSRSCVFIGTTNRPKFLSDPTGNRRWYPLEYKQNADYLYDHKEECQADILQCWAEMYHYLKSGNEMANTFPNRKLMSIIERHQRAAEEDDPDIGLIEDYLYGKEKVCLMQVCIEGLGIDWRKLNRTERNAISAKLTGNKIGCTIKMTKNGNKPSQERFKTYGTQQAYIVPSRFRKEKASKQK